MSKRPPSSSSASTSPASSTAAVKEDNSTSADNLSKRRSPDLNEKPKKARSDGETTTTLRSTSGDGGDNDDQEKCHTENPKAQESTVNQNENAIHKRDCPSAPTTTTAESVLPSTCHRSAETTKTDFGRKKMSQSDITNMAKRIKRKLPPVMDMETALASLFPDTATDDSGSDVIGDGREMLTIMEEEDETTEENENERKSVKHRQQRQCWVRFRPGHAGDASSLASLCQRAQKEGQSGNCGPNKDGSSSAAAANQEEEDTSAAEMRLASGFGDEDTPPAFHAILAEVFWNNGSCNNHYGNNEKERNVESDGQHKRGVVVKSDGLQVSKSEKECHEISSSKAEEEEEASKNAASINEEEKKSKNSIATTVVDTKKSSNKRQRHEVQKILGAAAIVTLEWDTLNNGGARVLRVVFLHVAEVAKGENENVKHEDNNAIPPQYDRDLLRRRLLLRLGALGLATGCDSLRLPPY
uniref:Uncharacterized protein n=1 Tax=Ditylum brightwellii TaxID=49249 RepID=A0A7S4R6P0_9STRA